jgi:hypothetical protein
MPTPAAALATFAGKIATTTGYTRLTSDHERLLQTLAVGSGGFQLIGAACKVDERGDGNNEYRVLFMRVDVHHRLSGSERTYTESASAGTMQVVQDLLLDPDYWRVAGTTYAVDDAPAMALSDVKRVGKVISYTVTVAVRLVP